MQIASAEQTNFSAWALELMLRRDIEPADQKKFGRIMDSFESSGKSAQEYLSCLSSRELDIVRRVHCLADDISPKGLNQEGATNLLRQPGDQIDINNDGIAYVGRARTRVFPPQNASPAMKKAYEEALAALPAMEVEKMVIATAPFMAAEAGANIKYNSHGKPCGIYQPGDAGYTDIYSEPGFSYQELCEEMLANLELTRHTNTERVYQLSKNFLEMFMDNLQKYGVH